MVVTLRKAVDEVFVDGRQAPNKTSRPHSERQASREPTSRQTPKAPKSNRVGNRQAIPSRAPKAPIPGNERDDLRP